MIGVILLSLGVLLCAILYPTLSTTIVNAGVLDPIPPNLTPPAASCILKSDSKYLFGCENGQTILDGKFAFLACAVDVKSRYQWFPPTDKLDSSVIPKGVITLFDFSTETPIPLKFEGFPENEDFAPHGISALADPNNNVYIAAVNHKRSGSTIELFIHTLGTETLQYRKTVSNQDLLNAPNDVVLIGKEEFYATNDLYSRGLLRKLALYFRFAHGRVVYYDGNRMKTVLPDLVYPNGIVANDDMQKIYVASSLERKLYIYERNEINNRLRLTDSVDVGIIIDNLDYDPKTKSILVTGHSHAFKFMSAAESSHGGPSPSVVVKVYPNTDKDLFYGKKFKADRVYVDDGKILSCGTIALVGSGKSLISGIYSEGVVICDKPLVV